MEDNLHNLWTFTYWGLGICASGFFTLLVIVLKTSKDSQVTLQEIRDGLMGDFKNPGIVPKVFSHEEEIRRMKERCDRFHPEGPMRG